MADNSMKEEIDRLRKIADWSILYMLFACAFSFILVGAVILGSCHVYSQ